MFNPKQLSENIKKSRMRLNLTQTELADKLFVSSQAVSKWEAGQTVPDIENLCALADVFSCSVDCLIGVDAQNEKLFIGIDGGATKTEFLLCTESGIIVERLLRVGSNPNVCGLEKACETLKDGIDFFLERHSHIEGIFCGVAGSMSGENGKKIKAFLHKKYPLLKSEVGSDILNVIYGGPSADKCIAVILGTGFAVYANQNEELSRIGAWGYLLDDLGGGFGLGKAVLQAVLAENDGLGEKTMLTDLVQEKLGTTVWESIDKIYKGGDSMVASFAPLAFKASAADDAVAEKIMEAFVQNIIKHLKCALKKHTYTKEVVLAGGLIQSNPELEQRIKKGFDGCNITVLTLPQSYGACRKCVTTYGSPTEQFEENFIKSYALFV